MYQLMNGFRLSQLTAHVSAAQLRGQERPNGQLGHPATVHPMATLAREPVIA
jgi:hypothetical protein